MQYSHKSKNLYNYANYIFKNQLKFKHFTSEFEMMDILRYHPSYTSLPAHTAQQVIKFLVKAWKGYFRSVKEFKINPKKFKAAPKPPNYKRKAGFHILYFTENQVRIRNGIVIFPKMIGLSVKTRLCVVVKHARIIPRGDSFLLELVYEKKVPPLMPVKNIVSVDFGVNNLIAMVSNVGKPAIISGKPLKSTTQWFNKEKARLSSIYMLQQGTERVSYGQAMKHLMKRKERKTEDDLHQASRLFINECIANNADTIVVGYNEGWKQDINIGRINNQNFVGIPFLNLLRKIEYKAEDAGIRVICVEESYTSKCSFVDNELIEKHSRYAGRRVHRGLFRSSNGILINADCNAAGNIGRKVFPMKFFYGTVDVVSHPVCLSIQR
jgi:putative transposase